MILVRQYGAPTTLRCRLFGHKFEYHGSVGTCTRKKCQIAEAPANLTTIR